MRPIIPYLAAIMLAPVAAAAQHSHGGAPSSEPRSSPVEERPPRTYDPPRPDRTIEITATTEGFVPSSVAVKKGERVRLILKGSVAEGAPREFILDEFLVWKRLSAKEVVTETFTTGRTGEFQFHSQDGLRSGVFKVE